MFNNIVINEHKCDSHILILDKLLRILLNLYQPEFIIIIRGLSKIKKGIIQALANQSRPKLMCGLGTD